MDSLQRRNLILLALGQGLTGSIISLMTLCSTLVGVSMTPVPLLKRQLPEVNGFPSLSRAGC